MNEEQQNVINNCLREILWVALVYNDHNFMPDVLIEKCRAVADRLECKTVDDANELLFKMEK